MSGYPTKNPGRKFDKKMFQNDRDHCSTTAFQFPLLKIDTMVIAGIITLFFLVILGLLLVPIVIHIDTCTNQYYLQISGLARVSLEGHESELIRIRLRTLFRNFYFYPLTEIGAIKRRRIVKEKAKKRSHRMAPRKIWALLKTFKVKKLLVDIDTGNSISNAKLYPAFTFLNFYAGRFNINFEGRNQVVLSIHNRPFYIIKSLINT